MKKTAIYILIMCMCLAGCGKKEENSSPEAPETAILELYCGAGIRPAAEALMNAFEKENPHIDISATYAGSGRLLGQLTAIQKGDLFMPGAELYVDLAIEKKLADSDTKKIAAFFIPVIFVQKGNPHKIKVLTDLSKKGIRVGLGDERACAVGKRSLKIFEKNKISYETIKPNVVLKTGTVNELGVAIELGNVDAVIMWDATAGNFADKGEIIQIPAEQNIPSRIPIAVLSFSPHPAEATLFIDFVISDKGKEILKKKNYKTSLK